jgi:hypothetical protein
MAAPMQRKIDLRAARSDQTSQHGEDGIIAAIFEEIGVESKRCVEFGAYDLSEHSNVRALWYDGDWNAILIEGDPERAQAIQQAYDRETGRGGTATIVQGFVQPTGPDSIDERLARLGWAPETVDLLVIDVDGIDFQIFKSLTGRPRVVMVEFNPTIPPHLSVIGNDNGNYLGASARAVVDLGISKGYTLVACTKVNAIFVRADIATPFSNTNDLDFWFDPYAVTYLMTAYDGSVFCSKPPHFVSNLLSPRAKKDLADSSAYWIPTQHLDAGYLFTRLLYQATEKVMAPVARKALNTLRAYRRRTGKAFFAPSRTLQRRS